MNNEKTKNILMGIGIILIIIFIGLLLANKAKPKVYSITIQNSGQSTVLKTNNKGYLEEPKKPTKDGYIFEGWYIDGEKVDFKKPFKEDAIIEVKWKKVVEENTHDEEKVETDDNIKTEEEKKPSTTTKKIKVKSLTISNDTLIMEIDNSITLSVEIKPDNATNKTIKWTSSNSDVVKVDNIGNITSLKAGNATITAEVDGKKVSCNVTVKAQITYSIEWIKEPETTVEQYRVYIKNSEGKYVSGIVEIETLTGKIFEEKITKNGSENIYIKSAIKEVKIKAIG